MKTRFVQLLEALRGSLWFIPTMLAALSTALSFVMISVDRAVVEDPVESLRWMYINQPEGARALLSTVAGSMITVAGVVFSITIVALTLASSQFGPRLLRSFMRDRANQIVLGVFIATFLYCLLVLRTIRGGEETSFVPHLSVTVGVLLAVLSLGVLIYFIHHASSSIQAEHVIAAVSEELESGLERLFPEHVGAGDESTAGDDRGAEATDAGVDQGIEAALPNRFDDEALALDAPSSDYLQAIDTGTVMEVARERDLVVRLCHRPGDFVVCGRTLGRVWPAGRVNEEAEARLRGCFLLGSHRTLPQDAEFVLQQLVEVAVRALSPGVNDPFTALNVLDRLESGLSKLAQRRFPPAVHRDDEGRVRVVADVTTFGGWMDAAFHPVRQYGRDSVPVILRLLEVLAGIAGDARTNEQRRALRRHAELAYQAAESFPDEPDRRDAEERYRRVRQALERSAAADGDRRSAPGPAVGGAARGARA